MSQNPSRNYVFTSFMDKADFEFNAEKIKYLIYGVEKCPTTRRSHLQGYVEFKAAQRLAAAKTILGDDAIHLEKRAGTREQAITYCKKDGDFTEFGENHGQGYRSDIAAGLECKNFDELVEQQPVLAVKYGRGFEKVFNVRIGKELPDWRPVDVTVYWGESRTGKTRSAIEESIECGNSYFKLACSSDQVWFDGYTGQKILILDEYYGQIRYDFFLQMLDGYKLQLPVKGGFVWAQYDMIYITSNMDPYELYSKRANRKGLIGRLKEAYIVEFGVCATSHVKCRVQGCRLYDCANIVKSDRFN